MVDGTRKRRKSSDAPRRRWYAMYRAQRFRRRFGWPVELPARHVRAMCSGSGQQELDRN